MDEVETGSESGLSQVESEAFSDDTPIGDEGEETTAVEETRTFEDDEIIGDEDDTETTDSVEDVDVDDDDETVKPANFTDLEAANKHIAKLNRENARRRTEGKQFEVFEQFGDDKGWFTDVANSLLNDPKEGARELLRVAKNILGDEVAAVEEEVDLDKPMTLRELQEHQAKEAAKKAEQDRIENERKEQEKVIQGIFTKAEELGYKVGDPWAHTFFSIGAADEEHGGTAGDLEKAHAKVQAMRQQVIDEYIAGKTQQREDFPVTAEGAVIADKNPNQLKTWNEFIDSAIEYGNAAQNVGK